MTWKTLWIKVKGAKCKIRKEVLAKAATSVHPPSPAVLAGSLAEANAEVAALKERAEEVIRRFSVGLNDLNNDIGPDEITQWAFKVDDEPVVLSRSFKRAPAVASLASTTPPVARVTEIVFSSPLHSDENLAQELSFNAVQRVEPELSLQDFHISRTIGTGAFGKVYLSQHERDASTHAVKVVKKEKLNRNDGEYLIVEEQKVIRRLAETGSAFFLQLQASFHDSINFYIVTDFIAGGDLAVELRRARTLFPTSRTKFYMAELVHGLSFLHKQRIIHRDMKPENVFIDAKGHLVIGDFGLARCFDDADTLSHNVVEHIADKSYDSKLRRSPPRDDMTVSFCGTPGYTAPEMYKGQPYSYPVDVWSLGVVMFQMLFGKFPFDPEDNQSHKDVTLNRPLALPTSRPIDDHTRDVVEGLLTKCPTQRLNLETLQTLEYFNGVDWQRVAKRNYIVDWVPVLPKAPKKRSAKRTTCTHGVQLETGLLYDTVSDPHPEFSYVAPKWQHLKKHGNDSLLSSLRTGLQGAKNAFGSCFSTFSSHRRVGREKVHPVQVANAAGAVDGLSNSRLASSSRTDSDSSTRRHFSLSRDVSQAWKCILSVGARWIRSSATGGSTSAHGSSILQPPTGPPVTRTLVGAIPSGEGSSYLKRTGLRILSGLKKTPAARNEKLRELYLAPKVDMLA